MLRIQTKSTKTHLYESECVLEGAKVCWNTFHRICIDNLECEYEHASSMQALTRRPCHNEGTFWLFCRWHCDESADGGLNWRMCCNVYHNQDKCGCRWSDFGMGWMVELDWGSPVTIKAVVDVHNIMAQQGLLLHYPICSPLTGPQWLNWIWVNFLID